MLCEAVCIYTVFLGARLLVCRHPYVRRIYQYVWHCCWPCVVQFLYSMRRWWWRERGHRGAAAKIVLQDPTFNVVCGGGFWGEGVVAKCICTSKWWCTAVGNVSVCWFRRVARYRIHRVFRLLISKYMIFQCFGRKWTPSIYGFKHHVELNKRGINLFAQLSCFTNYIAQSLISCSYIWPKIYFLSNDIWYYNVCSLVNISIIKSTLEIHFFFACLKLAKKNSFYYVFSCNIQRIFWILSFWKYIFKLLSITLQNYCQILRNTLKLKYYSYHFYCLSTKLNLGLSFLFNLALCTLCMPIIF